MRYYNRKRRDSTIMRDNRIHEAYAQVVKELGDVFPFVSRTEIYRRVAGIVHLCTKTVANVLNHTKSTRL